MIVLPKSSTKSLSRKILETNDNTSYFKAIWYEFLTLEIKIDRNTEEEYQISNDVARGNSRSEYITIFLHYRMRVFRCMFFVELNQFFFLTNKFNLNTHKNSTVLHSTQVLSNFEHTKRYRNPLLLKQRYLD